MSRGRRTISTQAHSLDALARMGVFDLPTALKTGIPRATFLRRVANEEIERVGPGLYRHPKSKLGGSELDYTVACKRFGKQSVIGGYTALQHYDLIEEVPHRICVLVPPDKQTRDTRYQLLRTTLSSEIGVENHGDYRITTVERAVAEAFRYASKFGLKMAIQAARTAIRRKLTNERKILRIAKELGIESHVARHWEALLP